MNLILIQVFPVIGNLSLSYTSHDPFSFVFLNLFMSQAPLLIFHPKESVFVQYKKGLMNLIKIEVSSFNVAEMVKNLPAVLKTWVQSQVQEDPLEKGVATLSSILAWRIPWTEEPGRLQSMGLQRAGHDWVTNIFTFSLGLFIRFRGFRFSEEKVWTPSWDREQ